MADQPATSARRIALVGSSGGNLYRLGGDDPAHLLSSVARELARGGMELTEACFVAVDGSLDHAARRGGAPQRARLWRVVDGVPGVASSGTLAEIDAEARAADERIAAALDAGELDGIVVVSADPDEANAASIRAAAKAGVPAVGSGGSCVAAAEALGIAFVAASGTTGTTNETRARAYTAGLARHWGLPYTGTGLPRTLSQAWQRYDPRATLGDALPIVLAVSVVIGLSVWLGPTVSATVTSLLLPIVTVVIAYCAAQRAGVGGQASAVAGLVGGVAAQGTGVLGALVVGCAAGALAEAVVTATLFRRWPATGASIAGSGLTGLLTGLVVRGVLGDRGHALDLWLSGLLGAAVDHAGVVVGTALGLLLWPFVLRGIYHSVVLPLMVVEFAARGTSFLAAVDMVSLVVVSAGIAAATALRARARTPDRVAALHTLRVNALFGTYVEGSYPFVTSGPLQRAATYLCAGLGGCLVGTVGGAGVVYVPVPLLPLAGSPHLGLLWAVLATLGVTSVAAAVCTVVPSGRPIRADEERSGAG